MQFLFFAKHGILTAFINRMYTIKFLAMRILREQSKQSLLQLYHSNVLAV